MFRKSSHHGAIPVIGILLPALIYVILRWNHSLDRYVSAPRGHFEIVSLVAILATIVAVIVGIAGNRLRNIKVTFMSLAYISLAEIFALHGLSTPGFMMDMSHMPAIAAQLSVSLLSFWLWLSSASSDHPIMVLTARCQRWLVPVWTAVMTLFVGVCIMQPKILDSIPLDQHPIKWVFAFVAIALNFLTAFRYWQSYRYSLFPLQAAIVYSAGWAAVAEGIMVSGHEWWLSWWIYHFLLLLSTVVMIGGLVKQYANGASIAMAVKGLFTSNPSERVAAGISPSVRALVVATETRDSYTAGHNFRVAMYALKLAEAMRLSPDQLRAIAQGAIVHDVGKLKVPDEILNKPGRLTPDERAVIEQHPVTGYDMCKRLGFLKDELDIIRSHHERWDGTGYPDGLRGENIPIPARILAVVDVYDALTSQRSYREAWSHERAMQFITEQAGSQFEPTCVKAWIEVTKNQGASIDQYPEWAVFNESSTITHVALSNSGKPIS